MAYRRCPKHGWLETSEYAVSPVGETICPVCRQPTVDFSRDPPENYQPRPQMHEYVLQYFEETGQ